MPEADRPTWRELLDRAVQQLSAVADARVEVTHARGVPWDLLPAPRRLFHRCREQSWGSVGPFQLVERCICGAVRIDREGPWLGRHLRLRFSRVAIPPRRRENPGDTTPLVLELRDALRDLKDRGQDHG